MNVGIFANLKIIHIIFKIIGAVMESRLRYRFFSPGKIIKGAEIKSGQTVLEVGSGTEFYTVSAAEFIGNKGYLVAMDILPVAVKRISDRVKNFGLINVRVVQGDAMNMGF